jgi:hypothetical protein
LEKYLGMERHKLSYDPSDIAEAFSLVVNEDSQFLDTWLHANYELDVFEQTLFDELYEESKADASYWNEEELKIKMIGLLFRIAKVQIPKVSKVFYERPLSQSVNGYNLAVICDCLIATPLPFNKPTRPYFFLQEFKKKRGEKNDPEGQLLTAMLIAQAKNNDDQPIFGGYLFGTVWNFATLFKHHYAVSREYNATHRDDLLQIVFILRKLNELIQNRTK